MVEIRIDSNGTKHLFQRHWQFGVGSGHAALALRTDYVALLKKVREELGVTYVRFHGIFNDDMDVARSLADILPVKGAEFIRYLSRRFGAGKLQTGILRCGMSRICTHGNPIAVWHEMGSPVPASRKQVEQIKAESEPYEEALEYTYGDGSVRFEGDFSVNDIWLVRILFT